MADYGDVQLGRQQAEVYVDQVIVGLLSKGGLKPRLERRGRLRTITVKLPKD
nr:hypothetical protein [Mycobacterium eburneum]